MQSPVQLQFHSNQGLFTVSRRKSTALAQAEEAAKYPLPNSKHENLIDYLDEEVQDESSAVVEKNGSQGDDGTIDETIPRFALVHQIEVASFMLRGR